jgi:regulator of protease activity HflC (stomatin/prohibitin superfamily)
MNDRAKGEEQSAKGKEQRAKGEEQGQRAKSKGQGQEQKVKGKEPGAKHKMTKSDVRKTDNSAQNVRSISRLAPSSLPFANRRSLFQARPSVEVQSFRGCNG